MQFMQQMTLEDWKEGNNERFFTILHFRHSSSADTAEVA